MYAGALQPLMGRFQKRADDKSSRLKTAPPNTLKLYLIE